MITPNTDMRSASLPVCFGGGLCVCVCEAASQPCCSFKRRDNGFGVHAAGWQGITSSSSFISPYPWPNYHPTPARCSWTDVPVSWIFPPVWLRRRNSGIGQPEREDWVPPEKLEKRKFASTMTAALWLDLKIHSVSAFCVPDSSVDVPVPGMRVKPNGTNIPNQWPVTRCLLRGLDFTLSVCCRCVWSWHWLSDNSISS